MSDSFEKNLTELYTNDRESNLEHNAFDREILFYESVKSGNIDTVKLLYSRLAGEGYGKLSKDGLRNLKYHCIITIAILARYCVNGGMPMELAYHISDVFIQMVDECQKEEQVHDVHYDVIIKYTDEMNKLLNKKKYCTHIMRAVDYISDHLHESIRIDEVSANVGLSTPYFSKLFKQETGIVFQEYILIKKVEAAQKMLQFSSMPASEISAILNFSTQSYFIKIFKKYAGVTPKEFKNRFYNDKGIFKIE